MSCEECSDCAGMFAEEEEECESEPSAKRSKADDIWEGFSLLKQQGSDGACSACKRILANTSGRSSKEFVRSLNSLKSGSGPDFDAARRAFALFIISSGQSLSVVENYYFQHLASALNPRFPLSRANLEYDVLRLYEKEMHVMDHIMSEAAGALSLSRRIVGFRHLDFPDDVVSVADYVMSCYDDLDVEKKVMCITLDNALYDTSLADSVKTILHDEGKLLHGGVCHLHCFTEILSSIVQASLELMADVIEKIRQGIHHINFSEVTKEIFYQYAKEICHLDITVKLGADIVIYWDLTYKMLGCALHYKDALNHFASADETFLANFHLSDEEWDKVTSMEKFLKLVYDITCTFLSRVSKPASLYFLAVYKVHRLLDVTKVQENFMNPMVEDMKAKFDKYWSENSLILACAAVLDPRYKLNLISYCFRKIYSDTNASQHIDKVVALLRRLFTEYEKSTSSSSSAGTNIVEFHSKDDLFDDYSPPKQISELDWYLESPVMDLNSDLDILEFWSGISKCYPALANMARDIIAIPVSTVASKSAFTIGEKVLNPRRSDLSPDLLEPMVCLHDWMCPKDRNGIAVSAIEEYCGDEDEEDIKESDDHVGENSIEDSN